MVFFPAFEEISPRTPSHAFKSSADDVDCPTEFLLDKVLRLGDHIPGDEPENQWIEPVPASKTTLIKFFGYALLSTESGRFPLLSTLPDISAEVTVYQTNFLLVALGNYRLLYRMHVF